MVSDEAVKAAARAVATCIQHGSTPEAIASSALTAAVPYMQGEVREQALEEGFRKGLEAACEVIGAHSEYDGQLCCDGRECGCYGATVHQSMQHYIRVLSSPDHADAGKVEGDVEKWSIREIVAKAIAYHSVGDPHAKTIRGDQRWEWFVEEADNAYIAMRRTAGKGVRMAAYTYADTERWLSDIAGIIGAYPETEARLIPLYERVEQMQRKLVANDNVRDRIRSRLRQTAA